MINLSQTCLLILSFIIIVLLMVMNGKSKFGGGGYVSSSRGFRGVQVREEPRFHSDKTSLKDGAETVPNNANARKRGVSGDYINVMFDNGDIGWVHKTDYHGGPPPAAPAPSMGRGRGRGAAVPPPGAPAPSMGRGRGRGAAVPPPGAAAAAAGPGRGMGAAVRSDSPPGSAFVKSDTSMYARPDSDSRVIIVLGNEYENKPVLIIDDHSSSMFMEVRTEDGQQGWIRKTNIAEASLKINVIEDTIMYPDDSEDSDVVRTVNDGMMVRQINFGPHGRMEVITEDGRRGWISNYSIY